MEEQQGGKTEKNLLTLFPDAQPMDKSRSFKGHCVYSPEIKMSLVTEFESVKVSVSRSEFAREKGIPEGTFDGWYWKANGVMTQSRRKKACPSETVDIEPMLTERAEPFMPTVRLGVNGLEIETDVAGIRAILEASGKC